MLRERAGLINPAQSISNCPPNLNSLHFDFHRKAREKLITDKNIIRKGGIIFLDYHSARACLCVYFHLKRGEANELLRDLRDLKLLAYGRRGLIFKFNEGGSDER